MWIQAKLVDTHVAVPHGTVGWQCGAVEPTVGARPEKKNSKKEKRATF